MWTGLIWLTTGTSGELLRRRQTVGYHKMLELYGLDELLLASEEQLYCMELR